MSLRVCSIGYVPPKDFGNAQVFWDNLQRYPAKHELILYSDYDWGKDVIKLRTSPEILKNAVFGGEGPLKGKPNPFAIHNALFLAGLKMAKERGCSHALYLESDCRVGVAGWDDVIFSEYFDLGRPCIVAGTLAVYNPTNFGLKAARKFQRLIQNPPAHGIPTGVFGWQSAAALAPPLVFPNGALAVYDVAWITSMFDVEKQVDMAVQNTAFDQAIGCKLQDLFGEDAYEVIGSIGSVYSGFGEALTSQQERQDLLESGQVAAIHQIKDSWAP